MFLADQRVHPLIKSAVVQAWTMVVRPFAEGNERLGRILSSVILVRAGYTFFGEVSLSALIARKGYGYFDAVANIMREENGGDLTYFLEYYLELLSRAIDERRLRLSKKEEENHAAEVELAHSPLVPPTAQEEVTEAISLADYEEPVELQNTSEIDLPNVPEEWECTYGVQMLKQLAQNQDSRIGQCAYFLLQSLAEGKINFTCADIDEALGINYFTGGSLISQLKEQGIIEIFIDRAKNKVYHIATNSPADKADEKTISPYKADEYDPSILEKIDYLISSHRSSKDRRVGTILYECLEKGVVTIEDYVDIESESKWYTDMLLAQQLGLVEKETSRRYRLLRTPKEGPPLLSNTQKRIITEMYKSFGTEVFSLEMVVATLDYSGPHTSAVLHQFTLMNILNCKTGDMNLYQFLINPQDHPECFEKAA